MRLALAPWLCLLACLAGLGTAGCEEISTASLLDLDSVGPERIDPGHRLIVEGSGFAVGHDVRIALRGTLSRPFEIDEPIDETFVAQAVNEDRIEMRVTETLLRERFGRATFHGRVEVLFDVLWGDRAGTISGALEDQRIDFVPAHTASTDGVALDEALGVVFEDAADEGLEIARVAPGGRGAQLGLSIGDSLVEIGRAHLVPGDLPSVPRTSGATSLTIVRAGHASTLALDLAAYDGQERISEELVRLVQLALLIVWVALLGAWPLSSTFVAPAMPPRALSRPTLAIVARALAGLMLAHLALLSLGHLPPIGVVVAAIVGVRAAITMAGSPRPLAQLPVTVISSLALAVALSGLPAALDVSDISLLAQNGSPIPLEWPFFREPAGVLALLLLALAVGIARPARPLARAADDVLLLAVAVLAVLAGTGLAPVDRTGTLALDVAVVLVAWLLGRARAHGRATPMTLGLAVTISATLVVVASAWVVADPTAQVRRALAEVSLSGTVLAAIFALRAAIRDRPAPRPQHVLL